MTREEMLIFAKEQSEIFPEDCEMGVFLRNVVLIIEKNQKNIKALQNRCFALTHGTICLFCPIDCERRSTPYRSMVEEQQGENTDGKAYADRSGMDFADTPTLDYGA